MHCYIVKGSTPRRKMNAYVYNYSSISKGRKGQTCWCMPVVSVPWMLEDGRFSLQGKPWLCSTLKTSLRYMNYFF